MNRTTSFDDPFGNDPQVQYLRRIFASMEKKQRELLAQIGIAPFDERLPRLRQMALHFFEKAWMTATGQGIGSNEEETGQLYLYCLARVLSMQGIEVPADAVPRNETMETYLEEVLR